MGKDLFDYMVVPTKKEYRNKNVIDDIYGIVRLNIPRAALLFNSRDYLIDGAIINYNNEIVVAKTFYANMVKYQKYYIKYGFDEYDFWARKYGEQTLKQLYSIYDKSMHIINFLYDLKVIPDSDFKKNVRESLKEHDKRFYKRINSIYSRLYRDKTKNVVRDDITHNFSNLFFRYIPKYEEGKATGWYTEEAKPYNEYKEIIDKVCQLLSENRELLNSKLMEVYPAKGTAEYDDKMKKIREELNIL